MVDKSPAHQRHTGHVLLDFKTSHAEGMRLLAFDLQTSTEPAFLEQYLVSKFEVSSRLGQLQAFTRVAPLTAQVSNEITQLTLWFVSLLFTFRSHQQWTN